MARRKRRAGRTVASEQVEARPVASAKHWRARIPTWGWVLLFILPLVVSEFMFYMAGRIGSMILFPLVWVGFWAVTVRRSGWSFSKDRRA